MPAGRLVEQKAVITEGRAVSTGNGITALDGTQLANPRNGDLVTTGSTCFADWPRATTRYYCVDYDAGSDANLGFVDGTLTTAGAAAVALKTLEELNTRLPYIGADRNCVVVICSRAAGATYLNKAGVADDLILSGRYGYRRFIIRATGTNTTAAAVKFDNTAADKVFLGAQQVTGTNAAGYNPVAPITTSTFDVQLAGGGAPALAAEPGLIGKRIRFDAATTTAALRNVSRMIWQNDTDTITVDTNLPAVPVASDVFYIEEPAFAVASVRAETTSPEQTDGSTGALANFNAGMNIAGVATVGNITGAWVVNGRAISVRMAFCEQRTGTGGSSVLADCVDQVRIISDYIDEAGTTVTPGVGIRTTGGINISRVASLTISSSADVNASSGRVVCGTQATSFDVGAGCYFRTGIIIAGGSGLGTPRVTSGTSSAIIVVGNSSSTTKQKLRIVAPATEGAISIRQSNAHVRGADITGQGAIPAVKIIGQAVAVAVDDVIGSTGNTDVGVDVTDAVMATISLGKLVANTVTGTAGDIRVAGPAITTRAGLTITDVIDNQRNQLQGTGKGVVGDSVLVSNQSGGALVVGNIVASNGTSGQVTKPQADTTAHAMEVLGVMITPPASATNGYMVTTGAPWIQLDVAGTVGNICYLSEATAGQGKSVPPAAGAAGGNQKLRLGYIAEISGTLGRVAWQPELIPVDSNGIAP